MIGSKSIITKKLGQFNMITLLTSYSRFRLASFLQFSKCPLIGIHDHQTTLELVLKARLGIKFYCLSFYMSFVLDHIFKNHSSYSIKLSFNYNRGNK